MTHFRELGQKYKNTFVWFLVQTKILNFAFEMNWPLAAAVFKQDKRPPSYSNNNSVALSASLSIHSPKSNFSGKCQMVEGKCFVPLSVKLSFKAASEKCISKGGKLFEPREESINFQVLTAAWKGWRTFQPLTSQPQASTPDLSSTDFSTMNFPTPEFSTLDFSTMNFSTPDFSTLDFSTPDFQSWTFQPWIFEPLG